MLSTSKLRKVKPELKVEVQATVGNAWAIINANVQRLKHKLTKETQPKGTLDTI